MDEEQFRRFVAIVVAEWSQRTAAAEPPSDDELQALVRGDLTESAAVEVTTKAMGSSRGLARLRELEPLSTDDDGMAEDESEGVLVFPIQRLRLLRPAAGPLAAQLAASDVQESAPMFEDYSEGALRALVVASREGGLAVEVSRGGAMIRGARVSLYQIAPGREPERVAQGITDDMGVAELSGSPAFSPPPDRGFYQIVVMAPSDVPSDVRSRRTPDVSQ